MKVLSFEEARQSFDRRYVPLDEVAETVATVVQAVRERGDEALIELSEKFDRVKFASADKMAVTKAEFDAADAGVDHEVREATRLSRENVQAFAEKSKRRDWQDLNAQGAEVGEMFQPFQRVGIYVPGGTAPLISTVNMTVTIAAAAGCPEIVVCTPPAPDGSINPDMLYALRTAGATEVYKVGGAQAIAALALGTETIKPVDKIYGPGNAYVMEAKRQTFGAVAIDLLPGPSEVLVLADKTGTPAWIAADLLAQAEHGGDSVAVFVSDSQDLLDGVQAEIDRQAELLSRQGPLRKVLEENCTLVKVDDIRTQGIELTNAFAPEHLSLVAENDEQLLPLIRTAGAIFAGPYSPVAVGDFLAGPSHELPTGGACKAFAGLTVDQFQRRTSIVRLSKEALAKSTPIIETFARMEGLDAHGNSASIRLTE
ncbi:MAG: histidinol dehydrogenase [Verrucomicrobiales bacterium]|jgi:histidinol dehydrogenase